jgi:hypothetical protein
MSINKDLAKQAKRKGICEEWYNDLVNTTDTNALLSMYLRGIDFCLSNDYPTNDYIRKNFKGKMESFGIHLDESIHVANDKKIVALGKCTGIVEVSEYNISEVFLKHDSEITLKAEGNSFVVIDMFENTTLSVVAFDEAKVCINRYGGRVIQKVNGNALIKVIEKNKSTY